MHAKNKVFDSTIIGGGIYGCILALYFKKLYKRVALLEREPDLLLRASYNNQARVHNGYHYPRSFITALRSHINYARFIADFKSCIVDDSLMVYAIARGSKVTSSQFKKFCQQIGSPLTSASPKIKKLFNDRLIDDIFVVKEAVFDAYKLRELLKRKLQSAGVNVFLGKEVFKVTLDQNGIKIQLTDGEEIMSTQIFNCTYSNINTILSHSGLPQLSLKHELTEMPLLKLPTELKKMGITIMDGPFFSVMPFPDKKLHTIHHVRYTPLTSVLDVGKTTNKTFGKPSFKRKSNYLYMIKDAQRYVPLLQYAEYSGSLYETKTVLIANEISDARPILLRRDYGIKNFSVVMGGKIDNIYDIINELGL